MLRYLLLEVVLGVVQVVVDIMVGKNLIFLMMELLRDIVGTERLEIIQLIVLQLIAI